MQRQRAICSQLPSELRCSRDILLLRVQQKQIRTHKTCKFCTHTSMRAYTVYTCMQLCCNATKYMLLSRAENALQKTRASLLDVLLFFHYLFEFVRDVFFCFAFCFCLVCARIVCFLVRFLFFVPRFVICCFKICFVFFLLFQIDVFFY